MILKTDKNKYNCSLNCNCNDCDCCMFITNSDLEKHMAEVHEADEPCKCEVCGKLLTTSNEMMDHVEFNHKEYFSI